ncbi:MAG: NAD(P)H-dependent oxidoreductase [Spirochaetaceae bacterium]|nr:NAD(P)H-dependent oxidoreductase [Spirochaetaceae bacterium]
MKILVVYYSLEGNCGFIAEEIKKILGADLLRLETVDEKRRAGLAKYVWGGRQVFTKAKPPLKPYAADIDAYDLIIIGAPVWAGSPAPALNSFLAQTRIANKKLALFCCCGGGKGAFFDKLKAALPGNTFAGEIAFTNPGKEDPQKAREQLKGWLKIIT